MWLKALLNYLLAFLLQVIISGLMQRNCRWKIQMILCLMIISGVEYLYLMLLLEYICSTRQYNIGFSADQLFGAAAKIGNNCLLKLFTVQTYYLFGSYSFDRGKDIELRPSVFIKMSEQ